MAGASGLISLKKGDSQGSRPQHEEVPMGGKGGKGTSKNYIVFREERE